MVSRPAQILERPIVNDPAQIIVEQGEEHWFAYTPMLPGCIVTGATHEEAEQAVHELLLAGSSTPQMERTVSRTQPPASAQSHRAAETLGMLLAKRMPGSGSEKTGFVLGPLEQVLALALSSEEHALAEGLRDGFCRGLRQGEERTVHRSVLIVDDNPDHAFLTAQALRYSDAAFAPMMVGDGAGCLEVLQSLRPAAIVMDYRLPDMDGLMLLARVVEIEPSVAVIFVTGEGNEGVAVAATRLGAAAYVVKTVEYFKDLPRTVEMSISKRSQIR